MPKKKLKDLSNGKYFHLIIKERKIDHVVLPLTALYVIFLILTVMFNFGVFAKTVVVTFVILLIYFSICTAFNIYDKFNNKEK